MRNLKRALSLLLSSAMVLGMLVMGSSAASYTDVTSEKNVEAIEVLKAVGVMTGDENGNFNPDKAVTRNEMAVVMANLLNLDYEYYTGAKTSFTDVPEWAAKYVAACQANGIIAGYSNTIFGGNDNVTAAQAALMMMKALGYFKYQGDFENDWQLATVKQASKIDLYDGINAGATAPLTRNDVAQLVLNTLEADMVEFNGTVGTDITTSDGTTITVGYRAQYDPYTSTKGDYTPSDAPTGDSYLQLAEELFGSDLKKYVSATSDEFCRPSNKWTYNNKGVLKDIGTFAVEPTLTYTKAVTEADMYKDLGLSEATGTTAYTGWIDGASANGTLNKGDDTTKIGGNGALTEVFVDDSNNVTIVVTNTYIGEVVSVTKATSTADRYITIAGNNAVAGTFETEDFDKEDIVLYTYSNKAGDTGVKSVALAQKVTGQLTGYAAGKSLTVDGTTYEYSNKKDTIADGSTLKIDVNVYLDQYGYAIDVEGVKTDVDYAYMLKYNDKAGTYGNDKVAQLLMADGTVKDVQVKAVTSGGGVDFSSVKSGLVSYTVDSNDKYTLTGLDDMTEVTNTKTLTITKGNSTVTLDSNTPTTVNADGKTVFLVITGTSTDPIYTAYNGIANVPSITVTGDGSTDVYAYYTKSVGAAAEVIVVDARGAVVNTDATEIVYIVGDTTSPKVTDADGNYYVYDAVVDGQITTVKVDATLAEAANGLTSGNNFVYKSVNYNEKGIISSVGTAGSGNYGDVKTGTDKEANGTIGLAGSYYVYAKDCVVFYIDKDENITTSSIGAIAKDSTDTVKYVLNSDNKVVAIFVEEVSSSNKAVTAVDVYVDGVKATLAGGNSATAATISGSKPAAGKVITIVPTVSPMATSSNSVTGTTGDGTTGAASYVVTATDEYTDTVTFTITVIPEDGSAAATATFTLTLGES